MRRSTRPATTSELRQAALIADIAVQTADKVALQDWLQDGGTGQEYRRDVVWNNEATTVTLLVSRSTSQVLGAIAYGIGHPDGIMYDARMYMAKVNNPVMGQWTTFFAYAREDYVEMRHHLAEHIPEEVEIVTVVTDQISLTVLTA